MRREDRIIWSVFSLYGENLMGKIIVEVSETWIDILQ